MAAPRSEQFYYRDGRIWGTKSGWRELRTISRGGLINAVPRRILRVRRAVIALALKCEQARR